MARGELHIELSVNHADDEKLAGVSRDARLLYIDALCLAKKVLNDGAMSEGQALRICGGMSERAAKRAIAELVASGAWEQTDKGYSIPSWLKRNKSKAQVMAAQSKAIEDGIRGNHRRWHLDKIDPACPLCPSTEEPPDGESIGYSSGDPTDTRSGNDRVTRLGPETGGIAIDRDKDITTPPTPQGASRRRPKTSCPDIFPITDEMRDWAREHAPLVSPDVETPTFLSHHRSKDSKFSNWLQAWQTWMRNAQKWAGQRQKTADNRFDASGAYVAWDA